MKINDIVSRQKCESPMETKIFDALIEWGINFQIQVKKGKFRLDFYIPEHKICIEVDGFDAHKNTKEYDKMRDEFLTRKFGIKTYRFAGWRVNRHTHACIWTACGKFYKDSSMYKIGKSDVVHYLTECEGISIDRVESFIR